MNKRFFNQQNLTRRLRMLFVLFAMLLLPLGAWAQTDYGFSIGGTAVTSDNITSFSGVSYDTSNQTLTLTNATLTGKIERTNIQDLTVYFVGSSTITVNSSETYVFQNATSGQANLYFSTDETNPGSLTVNGISGIEKIADNGWLNKPSLTLPDNTAANYDWLVHAYSAYMENPAYMEITLNKKYDFWMGETQFCDGYLEPDAGIKFIPGTTPTLEYYYYGNYIFKSSLPALTVKVTTNGAKMGGLIFQPKGLVTNGTLTFTAEDGSNHYRLDINKNDGGQAISGFSSVDFQNSMKLCVPSSTAALETASDVIVATYDIYDIKVGGVEVTGSNAADVFNDGGSVSFTLASEETPATLTLNNAVLDMSNSSYYPIESSIKNLRVKLVNYNTITTSDTKNNVFVYNGSGSGATLTFVSDFDENSAYAYGVLRVNGISEVGSIVYGYGFNQDLEAPPTGESINTATSGWEFTTGEDYINIGYTAYYNLWRDNIRFTSNNLSQESGSALVFHPTTNTLHLENFNPTPLSTFTSKLTDPLIVELKGSTEVVNFNYSGTGNGKILFCKDNTSSYDENAISINNSEGGAITGFSSVEIEEPLALVIPASTPSDWNEVDEVKISDVISYNLVVNGIEVTSTNASNVLGGETATVVFTPANATEATPATLTLNGATIAGSIVSGLENLRVVINGANSAAEVMANSDAGGDKNITFVGGTGGTNGSTLTISAEDGGSAVSGFASVSYDGAYAAANVPFAYVSPKGYIRSHITGDDLDSNQDDLTITTVPHYPIWLYTSVTESTQVNDTNKNTLLSASGNVSFDGNHTLSLKNSVNCNARIVSGLSELTISVDGDCIIASPDTGSVVRSINASAPLTIEKASGASSASLKLATVVSKTAVKAFASLDYTGLILLSNGATYSSGALNDSGGNPLNVAIFTSSLKKPTLQMNYETDTYSFQNPNGGGTLKYSRYFANNEGTDEENQVDNGNTFQIFKNGRQNNDPCTVYFEVWVEANGNSSDKLYACRLDVKDMAATYGGTVPAPEFLPKAIEGVTVSGYSLGDHTEVAATVTEGNITLTGAGRQELDAIFSIPDGVEYIKTSTTETPKATFFLDVKPATPILSKATGSYAGTQTITVTNLTPNATAMYYTYEGEEPENPNAQAFPEGGVDISSSKTLAVYYVASYKTETSTEYLYSETVRETYTILEDPELKYMQGATAVTTAEWTLGKDDNPALPTLKNTNEVAVTYESSAPAVATVAADGTVTPVGVGTTTITASSAQTDAYTAGTASYTLNVFKDLSHSSITIEVAETTYNGEELEPAVTVKDGETSIAEFVSVAYANNTNAALSTAETAPTVTVTAIVPGEESGLETNWYTGSAQKTFTIKPATITTAVVTLSDDVDLIYNGEVKHPAVTKVAYTPEGAAAEHVFSADTDYDVSYSDGCIEPGDYIVTVTFKGNYTGTATATFTIITMLGGGEGTKESPYLIKNYNDLKDFATYVNNGTLTTQYVKLDADINCDGKTDFVPIGTGTNPFQGFFDGDFRAIYNLSMTDVVSPYVGVFGYNRGSIEKLKVDRCTISGGGGDGDNFVGAIAGKNTGIITFCSVEGTSTISAYSNASTSVYAGAVIGENTGGIENVATNTYESTVVTKTRKQGDTDYTVKSGQTQRGFGNGDDVLEKVQLYGVKTVTVYVPDAIGNDECEPVEGTYYMFNYPKIYVLPGLTFTYSMTPSNGYKPSFTLSDNTIEVTSEEKTNAESGSYDHTEFSFTMPEADLTATLSFVIDLASNNYTATIADVAYTSEAVVLGTVSLSYNDDEITPFTKDTQYTIEGYKSAKLEALDAAPVNVGTYHVTIKGVEAQGYTGTKDVQFNITQAENSLTTTPAAVVELAYTGEAQELVTAGVAKFGDVQYKLGADGIYSATIPTATDANTTGYTIYYKVEGTDNYAGIEEANVVVTIAKADATITKAPTANDLTYTGEAQALVEAGTVSAGTMVYSTTLTGTFSETIPTGTNAGPYTVYYKVNGNDNYNGIDASETNKVSVTIDPKELTADMVTLNPEKVEYNGATQKPEVTVADGTALTANDYTIENNGGVEVGKYDVVVTAKGNYTGEVTKQFEIVNRKLKAADVTFSENWASFYHPTENIDLPEGVAAYVLTAVGETTATATQISYIPAGVAVLLQNNVTTTTTNTSAEGNLMFHADEAVDVTTVGGTVYGLYNGKLMRVASGTIPAGKNFLMVSKTIGAPQLTITTDNTTAIEVLENAATLENSTDEWFTLDGRKLQQKPTKKGLYIKNGKTVVVNNK